MYISCNEIIGSLLLHEAEIVCLMIPIKTALTRLKKPSSQWESKQNELKSSTLAPHVKYFSPAACFKTPCLTSDRVTRYKMSNLAAIQSASGSNCFRWIPVPAKSLHKPSLAKGISEVLCTTKCDKIKYPTRTSSFFRVAIYNVYRWVYQNIAFFHLLHLNLISPQHNTDSKIFETNRGSFTF